MSNSRRVVFTGSGAVCGAGKTVEEIWDAMLNGRSAVAPIKQWDLGNWPVNVASEVPAWTTGRWCPTANCTRAFPRTDMLRPLRRRCRRAAIRPAPAS